MNATYYYIEQQQQDGTFTIVGGENGPLVKSVTKIEQEYPNGTYRICKVDNHGVKHILVEPFKHERPTQEPQLKQPILI